MTVWPLATGTDVVAPGELSRAANRTGSFNEYWYDALGRRVVIRSRQETGDTLCNQTCLDATEYVVWDGDQVIAEERLAFSSSFNFTQYQGFVIYAHGHGIDNPLSILRKNEYLVPHLDWRGEFLAVTNEEGEQVLTEQLKAGTLPGREQVSSYVDVPRTASHWYGSLLRGNRGTDGLVYRRNRYYDPAAGRFTQEDPIGLAGGANLYGYAAGDPVNMSDPFGLCPPCPPPGSADPFDNIGDGLRPFVRVGAGLATFSGLGRSLVNHFFDGGGATYGLSAEEFAETEAAILSTGVDMSPGTRGVDLNGTGLADAFGDVTATFDEQGLVRVEDRYDFNARAPGERALVAELATSVMRHIAGLYDTADFEIVGERDEP